MTIKVNLPRKKDMNQRKEEEKVEMIEGRNEDMETKYTAHKQDVNPNLYTQEIASA
jgi:hypothetical protein